MKLLAALTLLLCSPVTTPAQTVAEAQAPPHAVDAARRVVATLSLAAQEYRLAFADGELVNEAEYLEARLFVEEARRSARDIPGPLGSSVTQRLERLERRLAARFPAESLAIEARAVEAQLSVSLGVSLDERPSREPSYASGERLFVQRCASCHGESGLGNGTAGAGLDPPPANLTDTSLMASTTPLDVYRKVTLGVPGTAMPAYGRMLSREERWDVVAYVFTLTDPLARAGRSGPMAVVFGTVRGTLAAALDLAAQGERDMAARKVLDAYLAFEAVERALGATDPNLVSRIEQRFMTLRAAAASADSAELRAFHDDLGVSLGEAERSLTRGRSRAGLFFESLLLILREGFEAILVIGAIMAVLVKAGAKRRQHDVRVGVGAAIVASLATAALIEWVFRITPAQREALEGGVMLLAAGLLFYTSYWLVSKVELAAWTRFVKHSIQRAAESGSALLLGGVAFLAVYREGFETVLFYKALLVSGGQGAALPVSGGLLVGLALLAMLFVAIERFGLRVPMRPFFAVTGATLAYMSFVFAGTAVKEFQEGGYLWSTVIHNGPRNEFLGIYPTWESLAVQSAMLIAMLVALAWAFVVRPRRLRSAGTFEPAQPGAQGKAPDQERPGAGPTGRKAVGV